MVVLAAEVGTEVLYMGYLDCLHLEDAKLTCVFPHKEFVTDDKNAASLVLYYQDGAFDGLFTGEIGTDEEKWIAKHCDEWLEVQSDKGDDNGKSANNDKNVQKDKVSFGIVTGIDFYKVAHHGSKYSNSKLLLEMLKPEIAVVSAGMNNWYGHPHADTLERLAAIGCAVWNTAECGQIMIEGDADIVVTTVLCPD